MNVFVIAYYIKKAVEQKDFEIQKATPPMVFVIDDQN